MGASSSSSAPGDEAAGRLYIVNAADGGAPDQLSEQTFEDPGRFSPDGGSVLTSAGGQLLLVDLEGAVVQTIGEANAFLFGPVWSPDGEWIAYSSTIEGFQADVIVSRPDGSERWQVTHTPDNEIVVEWGAAAS